MPLLTEVRDEITSESHLRDLVEDTSDLLYENIWLFGMVEESMVEEDEEDRRSEEFLESFSHCTYLRRYRTH